MAAIDYTQEGRGGEGGGRGTKAYPGRPMDNPGKFAQMDWVQNADCILGGKPTDSE